MTEQNKRSLAAKKRAAEQKLLDPMFFKRKGSLGGSAKVPKGLAMLTKEQQREFSSKGVAARKAKNDLKGKDLHE